MEIARQVRGILSKCVCMGERSGRAYWQPRIEALPWAPAAAQASFTVIGVTLCLFLLEPLLQGRAPFVLYIVAVMFSAWHGGWRAGLLSTALAATFGANLFLRTRGQSVFTDPGALVHLTLFLVTAFVTTYLNHLLRHGKRQALAYAEELQRAKENLEDAVGERTQQLSEVNELVVELNVLLQGEAKQLERTNKELESFSYSVSHDLRGPLRTINAQASFIAEDTDDPAILAKVEKIKASTRQMDGLINDMLELGRVSTAELKREPLDLSQMVRQALVSVQERHPRDSVEINVQEGVTARADAGLVAILLDNLLRNAWKYSGNKPVTRIEFRQEDDGGRPAFVIQDWGEGFDPALRHRLFRPFQRLHGEKEFEGTGVGLSIVKRIVDRHGGDVWAESTPGEGATFRFTLGQ